MDSVFEQTISIVKQAGEIIADRISDTYTIIP